jgi:hypothetical protein
MVHVAQPKTFLSMRASRTWSGAEEQRCGSALVCQVSLANGEFEIEIPSRRFIWQFVSFASRNIIPFDALGFFFRPSEAGNIVMVLFLSS